MTKKTKRSAPRTPQRRPSTSVTSGIEEGASAPLPVPEAPAVVAARRRVERINTVRPGRPGRGVAAADFAPLDPGDAAIPFDRVPYVPGDLRRVAFMAVLMVALIIVAAIFVPKLIGN